MKLLLLLILVFKSLEAYQILIVYPFPVKSLSILGHGLSEHLLKAGHEVTFITVFPRRKSVPRFQEIDVSSNIDYFHSNRNVSSKISFAMNNKDVAFDTEQMQKSALDIARLTFENENVQKMLKNLNITFDVVISDYVETEIYASFAALYQCPMIWSYSLAPNWASMRLLNEIANPAYTADYLSYNIHPFTFYQRIQELWTQIKWRSIKRFKVNSLENEVYKHIFSPFAKIRNISLPSYNKIIFNASLVLSNYHGAFGNIPSLPQNMKLIAGYHVDAPVAKLPTDLDRILSNAPDGAIYFSMGSMWMSKDFPKTVQNELLQMFAELNETVIWKYEESISGLPDNVHIVNWAPQQSILAHPNLQVFITHAGLLSTTEAINFGVPVIGIPVHYDQFININKAVANGYAIKVDLSFDMARHLKVALHEMLHNPKYKLKAKDYSRIFHHRLMEPGPEAVFWIEHIIKTKGGLHLRSASEYSSLYQNITALTLLVILSLIVFMMYSMLIKCFRRLYYFKIKIHKLA